MDNLTFEELTRDLAPTPAAYLKASRAIVSGAVSGLRPLKVAVLATYTAEFLGPFLIVEGARRGFQLDVRFAPWGQIEEQVLNPASQIYAEEPNVVMVLTRLEEWLPETWNRYLGVPDAVKREQIGGLRNRLSNIAVAIRKQCAAKIFVANYGMPRQLSAGLADIGMAFPQTDFVHEANRAVAEACRSVSDAFVLDFNRWTQASDFSWFDPKLMYLARLPFSVLGQIEFARQTARTVRAAFVPPAKVLALDLDNTLWGGILGEDGIGGIALGDEYPGNVFKAFQRYLLTLKDRGVVLVIASKNNEHEVNDVFARHRDCLLKREDFAAVRIDWAPKSENLRSIAAELNLGLDAFVFFDDSPFEREEVRRNAPRVRIIEAPASPMQFIEAIEASEHFDSLTIATEDRLRTETYRQNAARRAAEEAAQSPEDFLRGLELEAAIGIVADETLPRVAQLLGKTNQFNLTTRRHTAAEVQEMINAGAVALWLRLRDRFGDHGLVAVGLAKEVAPGQWTIDSFLLSCRAIGRSAETALLARLCEEVKQRGGREIFGEYVPTDRNGVARDFYERHGFEPSGENRWRLELDSRGVKYPDFIAIHAI